MNAVKRLGVILLLGSFFALLTERVMAPPAGAGIHSLTALMAPALVGCNPNCPGDVNGDNMVNGADLSVLLANFGNVCTPPDADGDGVPDNVDNCPAVFNPAQDDVDSDGVGDACDNCPFVSNPGQQDSNSNGVGDACEGSYCQFASQCPTRPNSSPVCVANQCGFFCDPGYADCDGDPLNGCEVFVLGDPNNCSACNVVCPPNHICVNGQCVFQCPLGFTNCGGNCYDLLTDPSNCGACGFVCILQNATSTCVLGQCSISSCAPGFANCNGLNADGCEIDINTNTNHCGACGVVCTFTANVTSVTCLNGNCKITGCLPNWFDQNGIYADGCEVFNNPN